MNRRVEASVPSEVTGGDIEAALRITPLFYDAALDPQRWEDALAAMCAWFEPCKAGTVHFNGYGVLSEGAAKEPHYLLYNHGLSARAIEDYLSYGSYGPDVDPRHDPYHSRYLNRPMACRDLVTTEAWHSAPMYRDVFKPHGLDFNLVLVIKNENYENYLGIGLYRGPEGPAFSVHDVDKFQLLVPHLRRASDVYARILSSELKSRQVERAFADLALGTVFTDTNARILFSNRSALSLLDAEDGLIELGGALSHSDAKIAAQLNQTIREISVGNQSAGDVRVKHLTLPRRIGPPLLATVCSLASSSADNRPLLTSQFQVAVFLTDPTKSYETTTEHLQRIFGLTLTEAEVAKDVASGSTLKDIAGRRDRSVDTIRQHLKSVMSKTGAQRQAELVKQVLSLGIPVTE